MDALLHLVRKTSTCQGLMYRLPHRLIQIAC